VDRVFVVGRIGINMRFKDLNPSSKIKKILRKRAIKNVEEHITYQQKKVSDYSIEELRKLILSEEKKILHGAGWKGAIVAVGAMFGITNF
jgi:hypothetical protein|tara:strand:- start:39 stop:308 length:270 start_codon:yes stop_codon:yes gene_type:complete